jgi:mannose-6-phosphate isomerase class I
MTLYFPSKEEVKEINDAAHKAGLPYAHYAREMIRRGMDLPTAPHSDILMETQQTREELARLKRELKDKLATIEKLETDNFRLRHQTFLAPTSSDKDEYSSDLIDLLQDRRVRRSDAIMEELGIDAKNIDAIRVLAGQLHALQDLKLVEDGPRGWRWIG